MCLQCSDKRVVGLLRENLVVKKLDSILLDLETSSERKDWELAQFLRTEIERQVDLAEQWGREEGEGDYERNYGGFEVDIEELKEEKEELEEELDYKCSEILDLKQKIIELAKGKKEYQDALGQIRNILSKLGIN